MSLMPSPAAAIRVCQVLEGGFAMLNEGVTLAAVRSDAQLHGYDVDVRRAVLAGRDYSVRAFESYGEAMVRTRAGECDIGWATYFITASRSQCSEDPFLCRPLDDASANGTVDSWTPYRCCVDFSVNVWPSEIGVLYTDTGVSFYSAVFSMVSSPFFLNFLSFMFIWVVIIAHLVWLAERRQNSEQYPVRYLDGIRESIWWAMVTFTTVGYGDQVPWTPAGKVLGIAWMILGITMYSVLVGGQVTHFNDIINDVSKSIEELDLRGMRVCGYSSVFSSWFLPPSLGYQQAVVANNLAACGEKMQRGEVDIIVVERPNLVWYEKTAAWDSSRVPAWSRRISDAIAQVPAGVAFPKNSTLRGEIDLQLIQLNETPLLREAQARWFATAETVSQESVQWEMVGPALGLVVLYLMLIGAQILHNRNERVQRFTLRASQVGGEVLRRMTAETTLGSDAAGTSVTAAAHPREAQNSAGGSQEEPDQRQYAAVPRELPTSSGAPSGFPPAPALVGETPMPSVAQGGLQATRAPTREVSARATTMGGFRPMPPHRPTGPAVRARHTYRGPGLPPAQSLRLPPPRQTVQAIRRHDTV